MISEDVPLIASDKFIQKFVYAIIQNIRAKNFTYEERDVIHTEMVPRMSERTMQASLTERVIAKPSIMPIPVTPIVVRKKVDMSALIAPIVIPRQRAPMPRIVPRMMMPVRVQIATPIQALAPVVPMIEMPTAPQGAGLSQDYGKITGLLNDPSVSTIECAGVGKPILIIRAGQRQLTKINLTAEEIKEILLKVSDAVHIPLLEGVFRAAVDNFSINAVISEIIGSRFVIRKQTAYALLER